MIPDPIRMSWEKVLLTPIQLTLLPAFTVLISVTGPHPINQVEELAVEDGKLVRRWRRDAFAPAEWGI